MPHICVSEYGQHWLIVAYSAPSHYLNQCGVVVRTFGDKIQWHRNRNSYIFIKENTFENVVGHFVRRRSANVLYWHHHNDVIMSSLALQINSLTIIYSTDYSGADQRKHQSSASLAFVRGIHRWPVNSPHKGPVTRKKMFPLDDVIMLRQSHDYPMAVT